MYINFVRSTIGFCLLVSTIHINYAMQTTMPEDPQEGSLLCQLPQDILYLIAENLEAIEQYRDDITRERHSGWKLINLLGSTCKMLDRKITVPSKILYLDYYRRREDMPVRQFLFRWLPFMQRISSKEAYNPIYLVLRDNNLGADPIALQEFLERCSQPPIVTKLKRLGLSENNIESFPDAITKLRFLNILDLSGNSLKDGVVVQVAKIESLQNLRLVATDITTLDPAITNLHNLTGLCLAFNKIGKESLEHIIRLKNLKQLGIGSTGITYTDIVRSFVAWQGRPLLEIKAGCLKQGELPRKEEIQLLRKMPWIRVSEDY